MLISKYQFQIRIDWQTCTSAAQSLAMRIECVEDTRLDHHNKNPSGVTSQKSSVSNDCSLNKDVVPERFWLDHAIVLAGQKCGQNEHNDCSDNRLCSYFFALVPHEFHLDGQLHITFRQRNAVVFGVRKINIA